MLAATETSPDISNDNIYPVYSSQTKNEGLMGYYSDYLYEDAITWTTDGANAGTVKFRKGKFYCTNVCGVLLSNEGIANKAVAESLNAVAWKYVSHVGNPKLMNNVMSEIEIMIPKSVEEQLKISEYLDTFDNLITLHQRESYRFKGKHKTWEQRKFSDFTWNAGKRNKDGLDLEPYAITNEHGFIKQSEAHDDFGYMKDTDRKAYNIVMPNSFAYNPARINVGSIGYYEGHENVIVSSLYEVFQTADYVDDRFLWHWFKSDEFPKWIERLQEGSVRLYFYYDKLCECQMLMPSVLEQKKIAEALDNLDNLITLHRRT